jgi:hypothetical protein
MAETELVKDLLKRFGKLVTQRQTWENPLARCIRLHDAKKSRCY